MSTENICNPAKNNKARNQQTFCNLSAPGLDNLLSESVAHISPSFGLQVGMVSFTTQMVRRDGTPAQLYTGASLGAELKKISSECQMMGTNNVGKQQLPSRGISLAITEKNAGLNWSLFDLLRTFPYFRIRFQAMLVPSCCNP